MATETTLHVWDYVTLALCVAISCIPGLYYSFRNKKATQLKEFLAINRKINVIPIILSAAASNLSAISILGLSTEAYTNGINFLMWSFAALASIPIAAYLFIPVYFRLNKISIYTYLEVRFNSVIRTCVSLIISVQLIFLTALGLYAPALAINQVTGLHLWAIIGITGVSGILYTAIGGFKAVVWADAWQFVMMTITVLVILIKGTVDVGGLNVIWDRLVSGNRSQLFIWSESPHSMYTFWTLMVANSVQKTGYIILNQSMMQRYLSNPTSSAGIITMIFFYTMIEILIGLVIYAHYYNCDPLLNGQIKKRDQLIALFSVEIFSRWKGISGIFIAGLTCASISTISSNLNSLAIITISDLITPIKSNLPEPALIKLSKILVFGLGGACIALVTIIEKQSGVMQLLFSILSLAGSPIIAIIVIGMLLPWVNSKGATFGFFAAMVLPWWSWLGRIMTPMPMPHSPYSIEGCVNGTTAKNTTLTVYSKIVERDALQQFYSIHPFWYTLWSLASGVLVSVIVSQITGFQKLDQVNPDLYFPFVRSYIMNTNSHENADVHYDKVESKEITNIALLSRNDNNEKAKSSTA